MFNCRCVCLLSKKESEEIKTVYCRIPGTYLILADIRIPKLCRNSRHRLSSIKTYLQARLIEKWAYSFSSPKNRNSRRRACQADIGPLLNSVIPKDGYSGQPRMAGCRQICRCTGSACEAEHRGLLILLVAAKRKTHFRCG